MKRILLPLIILVAVAAVVGGGKIYLDSQKSSELSPKPTPPNTSQDIATPQSGNSFVQQSFQNIKAAHFVSSNPANDQLLQTPISQVSISFNFDLAAPSEMRVTNGGSSVTTGSTTISGNNLTLSVPVNANQTGNYGVSYTACWADKSCHDGSFGFSVELSQ